VTQPRREEPEARRERRAVRVGDRGRTEGFEGADLRDADALLAAPA